MLDEKLRRENRGNRGGLLGKGKINGKDFSLEDISSSGCRIRYEGSLKIGETYALSLKIHGHPGLEKHVEVKAKTVRRISCSEIVGNEYALEFIGLSEMARIELDELINARNNKLVDNVDDNE